MSTKHEDAVLRAALRAAFRWLYEDTASMVPDPRKALANNRLSDDFKADLQAMHAGWKLLQGIRR